MSVEDKDRRFFGIREKFLFIGVCLSILFWVVDSFVDSFVFHEGSLIQALFSPEPVELWMRLLVVGLIISFSLYSQAKFTKRKRAEEALRQTHSELQKTKSHLESLIESSTDAIITTDRDGNVALFNPGAETILGYKREDVVGQRVSMLYESEEQAKTVMRLMREGGGTVSNFEVIKRAKDGSLIPVLISASILYDGEGREDGAVGFSKDLRELKRAEKLLKESEERFRSVTESAVDAIVTSDSDGNIISWNKSAQNIFGYAEEEILGKPLALLMPERYRDAHRGGMERLALTGESHLIGKTVELNGLRKDGGEFPVELSIATWKRGEKAFFGGIMRDITERRKAEELLRESEERLRKLNKAFLSLSPDFHSNIQRLVEACRDILEAGSAMYGRVMDGRIYPTGHWRGAYGGYHPAVTRPGHICYDVVKRGGKEGVVTVENVAETPYAQTDPNMAAHGLNTYVGHVVHCFGYTFGALVLAYREGVAFTEIDKQVMGILAVAIGIEEERMLAEVALRSPDPDLQRSADFPPIQKLPFN